MRANGKFRIRLPGADALFLTLAIAFSVSCLWVFPVRAADPRLSDYTTQQNEDGWYVHTFKNSRYYFLTSAKRGAVSIYPVTVVAPSGLDLSGQEALTHASGEDTASGRSYTFREAGTYTLTVTTPEEDGAQRYGKYYFTILPSAGTDGISADLSPEGSDYHVVKHSSGASYTTDIQEGEVLTRPGIVLTGAGMKAEVIYNGTKSSYTSGEKLTGSGTYQMIFTSSVLGREETSMLNFSIGDIKYKEPEDYGVHFPVNPSQSINTNLADLGAPDVGGWTWESSLKGDSEDWGSGSFESGTKAAEVTVLDTNQAEIKPVEVKLLGSSDSGPKWETSEDDAHTGPGAIRKTEESAEASSPKEVLVELAERYNEEYKIYELSFANKYFFYSNLGDGGITSRSRPAIFDVPANITVAMEKDGIPAPYNNKAAISEPGTYVFYLSVPDNQETDSGEPVVYKAVYHFRIEEKEPETEAALGGNQQDGGYYGFTGPAFSQGVPGGFESGDALTAGLAVRDQAAPDKETDQGTKENEDGAGQEGSGESGDTGYSGEGQLDENSTMEDIDALVDELTTPEQKEVKGAFSSDSPTGLKERYDSADQMYTQELMSGTVFHTSVPNGMLTPGPVTLTVPEGLTVIAQKDDQPYELTQGAPIQEAGIYRLEFQETKVDYALNYDMPPFFIFRIINSPVNNLELFNTPLGFAVTSFEKDGAPLSIEDDTCVSLKEDGKYSIGIVSDEWKKQYVLDLEKDTVPPQINLAGVEGGMSTGTSVTVEQLSEDIKLVEVYRNGSRDEGYRGGDITDSGNYRVMVYDDAGNVSRYAFQMKYKMNAASVVSIVLVILCGAAIAVYVRKVKKDVKVR